jgi:hypothetical protein
MKKKEYIKPETNILQSEPQAILAGSNVNTQRANIRRKLGLQPTDSLYEALKARMDGKIKNR